MATLRLEAELRDAPSIQRVERLQALLGTGNAELLRNALDLLDWCVSQVRLGRQITELIDNPPAPTTGLRALMSGESTDGRP